MKTVTKKRTVTRRQALGIARLAGAAYAVRPLRPFGTSDGAADPASAEGAGCVLAPEVTGGSDASDDKKVEAKLLSQRLIHSDRRRELMLTLRSEE